MKKTLIPINGMHCRSCELLIEGELCNIDGIKKAEVSQKKGKKAMKWTLFTFWMYSTDLRKVNIDIPAKKKAIA